jgi:hypothetical protein
MQTLEEIVQQLKELKDAQTVTGAQTLRHEERLKEHEQWLRDNELAYAKHREMVEQHDRMMADFGVGMQDLKDSLRQLSAKVDAFVDSLRKGGNGHN